MKLLVLPALLAIGLLGSSLAGAQTLGNCATSTPCVNGTGPYNTNTGDLWADAIGKFNANFLALPAEFFTTKITTVPHGGTGVASITGPIKGNGISAISAALAADIYALWSGTCSSTTFLRGDGACASTGTVTSLTLAAPSWLTVNNPTITTSGTITLSGTAETANLVIASPATGSPGAMAPRALVAADIPTISLSSGVSGTLQPGQAPALTGDVTSSAGSLTTAVGKVNGAAIPASAVALASNSSDQIIAATTTGSGSVVLSASPALVTPTLGVASATSINGTTVPASSTLLVNGGALGTPSSATLTNATGLPTTGLTGTLQAAQEPARTGDVTNTAGSLATTVVKVNGGALPVSSSALATNSLGQIIVGSAGGGGTVTTTGTPASGNLAAFSGSTAITNSNLSGDVTTSGTLATTVVKINGLAVPVSATVLGSNSSGQLVASTNTGTGSNVLATSPTLVTPALGTPSALVLTNATGLPNAGVIGLGTLATANAATPPVIGGTTPAAGSFSSLTDTGVTGLIQCLHASGAGLISGTGSDCGSGGGGLTSVGISLPSFLSVSNSPLVANGALAVSLSGTALPVANGGTGATAATGTGSAVLATSPTLVTPTLGAATATSINGNAFTAGSYTLTGSAAKTFDFTNSLTLSGTDATTLTFPGTSGTVDTLNSAQTFTAAKTFTNSDLLLLGSSTGVTTFTSANAGASNFTVTVPAATDTLVTLAATQSLTNKSIAASEVNSGTLAAGQMPALTGDVTSTSGTVATTVGKINGTALSGLATGILKNTTTTGVPSIAAAADIYGVFGCAGVATTFMNGAGGCTTPSGGGNVSNTGTPTSGQVGVWTSATVLSGVTATGTGSPVLATSPTLVTPVLGTPSSGTLTNATGLPISTGVSGMGTGAATFLATPSSANLAAAVTDETGTGALVFGTSPTLVTPALGTPSSGVATNFTGTATALNIGGTAANLSGTPALPNGTTATTQTTGDSTTKIATDAFVIANSAGVSSVAAGGGIAVTGTGAGPYTGAVTVSASAPNRTVTSSPTVASTDMGGQINSNVTGGGTLTIPAISSSVFPANSTLTVVNYSASTEAVSTTPTVNAGGGCVTGTGIPAAATWNITSNGTTLDCNQTVSAGGGSGTVASSTTGQIPVYTAATTVTGNANATLTAGALTLGVSGTAGSVKLGNATSGTVTVQPVTGALGAVTASLPANTGTLAELNLAQTFSALQTFGTSISIGGVTAAGATGTGNVVFATSPALTTPNLGTPSAATLTNATGLPISTGVSGLATGIAAQLAANTTFTITPTGCTPSAHAGGAFGGTITLATGPCTSIVVTMNGATGYTAAHGFDCSVDDQTTQAAGTWIPKWGQSASSITTATIPIPTAAGATDVISFSCAAN